VYHAGCRLLSSSLYPTDRDPHQSLYYLIAGGPLFGGARHKPGSLNEMIKFIVTALIFLLYFLAYYATNGPF